MFDYYYFIIMAHMEKKEKKSVVAKTTSPTGIMEYDDSYLDTMTGTNSSNDRLILR